MTICPYRRVPRLDQYSIISVTGQRILLPVKRDILCTSIPIMNTNLRSYRGTLARATCKAATGGGVMRHVSVINVQAFGMEGGTDFTRSSLSVSKSAASVPSAPNTSVI